LDRIQADRKQLSFKISHGIYDTAGIEVESTIRNIKYLAWDGK